MSTLAQRVAGLEWPRIAADLHAHGFARTGVLLAPQECESLSDSYDRTALFRSRVQMQRHGFGSGEYKYFAYPLPAPIAELRASLYPPLAAVANQWNDAMRLAERFPGQLGEMLQRCHDAGQKRPTPLLLKYVAGDYNCLHQDLYGEQVFPLQATLLLSEPGRDFDGGEFVLVEQRPRTQSRAHVVALARGEGVIFAVHHRPSRGSRGFHRVNMRHGVSTLNAGRRFTAGIIFHDAA